MFKGHARRAFTLVELLITVAVLGVIMSILMSSLMDASPDDNAMALKKAHNTLLQAVQRLTNDALIYGNGKLNDIPDGASNKTGYFCLQMAEQLNTTGAVVCSSATKATTNVISYSGSNGDAFDTACARRPSQVAFKTTDNIKWWGMYSEFNPNFNSDNIDTNYTVVCVDVDSKSSDIYAFGVRADGKVITSTKTAEKLNK